MIGANTPQPSIPAISIFPKSVWPSVAWREPVCWLILREILLLAAAGIAIGLPCALAASRVVASLLYGVSTNDPLTLAVTSAILITIAAAAGWLPARRATRVDPIVALRDE